MADFNLSNILNPSTWGLSNETANTLAAGASAAQLWNSANNYEKAGQTAAGMADPFGPNRGAYATRLNELYADPNKVAQTPGYQFALNQGLGAIDRAGASKGYLGSGKLDMDRMNYATGLASQTFDRERNALMQISGANFNNAPAAASSYLHGQDLANNTRNVAMGNLIQGLLSGVYSGNRTDPSGGGLNLPNGAKSITDVVNLAKSGVKWAIDYLKNNGIGAGSPGGDSPDTGVDQQGGGGPPATSGNGWHFDGSGNLVQDEPSGPGDAPDPGTVGVLPDTSNYTIGNPLPSFDDILNGGGLGDLPF